MVLDNPVESLRNMALIPDSGINSGVILCRWMYVGVGGCRCRRM